MPKGFPNPDLPTAESVVRYRKQGRDIQQVVALARKHTTFALKKIVELANGNAGKPVRVLNKDGVVVEIDVEVPASVQLKACEVIIERAYGKAPQAIMLGQDGSLGEAGAHLLPIAERILAIKAAREQRGQTTDLEASEQGEPEASEQGEPEASEQGEPEVFDIDPATPLLNPPPEPPRAVAPASPRDLI